MQRAMVLCICIDLYSKMSLPATTMVKGTRHGDTVTRLMRFREDERDIWHLGLGTGLDSLDT